MSKLSQFLIASSSTGAGISLRGPAAVTIDSTNTYTISDFDSFSNYEVSSTVGTVTRVDGDITLVIAAEETAASLTLSVTKNSVSSTYAITIGDSVVQAPTMSVDEAAGGIVGEYPTLRGSAFTTLPADGDTHMATSWEISTNSSFTNIIWHLRESSTSLTSATVGASLPANTTLYARVRYRGENFGLSAWSQVFTFTTDQSFIQNPVLSGPSSGNEGTVTTISITNYEVGTAYNITVTGGSVARSGSIISWTLPAVATDAQHTLQIYATKNTEVSDVVEHTLTVYNVLVEDTAIQVTDYAAVEDSSSGFEHV